MLTGVCLSLLRGCIPCGEFVAAAAGNGIAQWCMGVQAPMHNMHMLLHFRACDQANDRHSLLVISLLGMSACCMPLCCERVRHEVDCACIIWRPAPELDATTCIQIHCSMLVTHHACADRAMAQLLGAWCDQHWGAHHHSSCVTLLLPHLCPGGAWEVSGMHARHGFQ